MCACVCVCVCMCVCGYASDHVIVCTCAQLIRMIVDKVDKDKDGFVTEEELKDWIRHVSQQ